MISIEQLHIAEQQIESLLTQNESNWKAIAKIAIVVQQQELFKQAELNSFTAWVNAVAKNAIANRLSSGGISKLLSII